MTNIEIIKQMVALQKQIGIFQSSISSAKGELRTLNEKLWDSGMIGTDGDVVQIEIDSELWILEMCFPDEGTGYPSIKKSYAYRIKDGEIIEP